MIKRVRRGKETRRNKGKKKKEKKLEENNLFSSVPKNSFWTGTYEKTEAFSNTEASTRVAVASQQAER